MRQREANRRTGGILADVSKSILEATALTTKKDMGPWQDHSNLACVVQGRPTATDRRVGYREARCTYQPPETI